MASAQMIRAAVVTCAAATQCTRVGRRSGTCMATVLAAASAQTTMPATTAPRNMAQATGQGPAHSGDRLPRQQVWTPRNSSSPTIRGSSLSIGPHPIIRVRTPMIKQTWRRSGGRLLNPRRQLPTAPSSGLVGSAVLMYIVKVPVCRLLQGSALWP